MATVNEIIQQTHSEQMDKQARAAGFLPLISGEVYERQYAVRSHVFVVLDGNRWSAWRETWGGSSLKAVSYKIIVEHVPSFGVALQNAKRYADFVGRRK